MDQGEREGVAIVGGDGSSDPVVDLRRLPNRVYPVAPNFASRKDGPSSLRSKSNHRLLGRSGAELVKIRFDIAGVVGRQPSRKVIRILGEKAKLDTSDSLPDGRSPRDSKDPKLDNNARDSMGRHSNNAMSETVAETGVHAIVYLFTGEECRVRN